VSLFIDLDGVLSDFNGFYLQQFGARLTRQQGDKDPPDMWENIRRHGTFYREMPPLQDARELWEGVRRWNPVVLTGVPYVEVPTAEAQKRAWLKEHLGSDVPIICCRSKDKRLHGKPGDVLVDDWDKYQNLWVNMGGIFVLHRSARETLAVLDNLMGE
jgi:hypothetical protein